MDKNKENWKGNREGFGQALVELGESNPKVLVLTCDLTNSVRAEAFKKRFPDRFFQFGVAEQNMMGIAAGMSLVGYIPFVCTYAIFSAGRCWEQLRLSVCYTNCNVKIQGAHSGILVGPDGVSHQATEDIATTRVIPNLKVVVPCDSIEARKATLAAANTDGPIYIRLSREPMPIITTDQTDFILGQANIMRDGQDVTIIACGAEVCQALLAAEELAKEDINAAVVNLHTIKPIDKDTIVKFARKTRAVVTAEIHQAAGGMGSAVAEVLAQHCPVPMEMVGMKDCFGTSGLPLDLMKHFGLTSDEIKQAAKKVISRKT